MTEKYKDPKISVSERVDDLMSRMSFEQKIDQITCLVTITDSIPNFHDYIPNGIGNVGAFTVAPDAQAVAEYALRLQKYLVEDTPLGIPALIHCEAAAGAQYTDANVFPSAIAQASSFDPDAVREMAGVIREQLYAVGFRQALSPVLDVCRDPRWGRMTETYGEDPTLAAEMGSAFVGGLQWNGNKKEIIATAKHFVGHGVPEGGLNMARSMSSSRELEEVHCKPFQAAITESDLGSVMIAYCQIDGEPVICSSRILTDLLRKKMKFTGFTVSDYIAIDRLLDPFHTVSTFEEAGEKSISAGLDVEYPRPKGFTYQLKEAVKQGRLNQSVIDDAVRRVLTAKFEIGLFEHPYPDLPKLKNVIHQKDTDELNHKMACESIILLKNENKTLPLDKKVRKIAVIGPHADSVRGYFATFSYPAATELSLSREEDGQKFEEPSLLINDILQRFPGDIREATGRIEAGIRQEFSNTRTIAQAIAELLPNCDVKATPGINYAGNNLADLPNALDLAASSDLAILTLGGKNGWGNTSTVGEGNDSTSIGLPGEQEKFARAVYALHKKTVVIHFDGRPLSSEFVASHFDAILEVWQPGEFGGQAIAQILFGDYNPAGRLPVTAARNAGQLPVYYAMPRGSGYRSAGHTGMIRNKNGYINDTAKPLFSFGHGLSYSEFEYGTLRLSKKKLNAKSILTASIRVKNIGNYDGDEVVQLYISDVVSSVVRPDIELVGFQRIHLKKGEMKTVRFSLDLAQTAFISTDGLWKVEAGDFELMAGSSSDDIRSLEKFTVIDDCIVEGASRTFYAKATIH